MRTLDTVSRDLSDQMLSRMSDFIDAMAGIRVLQNNTAVVRILTANSRKILGTARRNLVDTSDAVEERHRVLTDLEETLDLAKRIQKLIADVQELESIETSDLPKALGMCEALRAQQREMTGILCLEPLFDRVMASRDRIDTQLVTSTGNLIDHFTSDLLETLVAAHTNAGRLSEFINEYQTSLTRRLARQPIQLASSLTHNPEAVGDTLAETVKGVAPKHVADLMLLVCSTIGGLALGFHGAISTYSTLKSSEVYRSLFTWRSFIVSAIDKDLSSAILALNLSLEFPETVGRVSTTVDALHLMLYRSFGYGLHSSLAAMETASASVISKLTDGLDKAIRGYFIDHGARTTKFVPITNPTGSEFTGLRNALAQSHPTHLAPFLATDDLLPIPENLVHPESFQILNDHPPREAARFFIEACLNARPEVTAIDLPPFLDAAVGTEGVLAMCHTLCSIATIVESRPHSVVVADRSVKAFLIDAVGLIAKRAIIEIGGEIPAEMDSGVPEILDVLESALLRSTPSVNDKKQPLIVDYMTFVVTVIESLAMLSGTLSYISHRLSGAHAIAMDPNALIHLSTIESLAAVMHSALNGTRKVVYSHLSVVCMPDLPELVAAVASMKWEPHSDSTATSPYVSNALQDVGKLVASVDQLMKGRIPPQARKLIVENAGAAIVAVLIDCYSKVRKCNTNGRSQMARDARQLTSGLCTLTGVDSVPGEEALGAYIRGWFEVETDFFVWLHEKGMSMFTAPQIIGLLNSVKLTDGYTLRAKQDFTTHVREMQNLGQLKAVPHPAIAAVANMTRNKK
ncbi:Protein of unknown function C-terminus (DUF2451) [Carpediemonas membranifera]|uniref:Uncharacterized protein n=1 Tax=Carpediemonas membranifera TaxID=201153 RepID=A0A8J6ARU7_9EUKA|nr:Protein of unknown function C-terminus (DUF2451) [Carpediemonas membranifera]|eukprot:KAG9392746.1 Protein of unknown function C-terminus (DUF2451) [Carpediemonas membranifera]